MSDYYISQISHSDKTAIQGVTALLQAEEIPWIPTLIIRAACTMMR